MNSELALALEKPVSRWRQIVTRRMAFVLPNAVAIGGLTAAAKVAGAIKTVVMARAFGTSPELDRYLLTFLIPSFLSEVLCGPIVPLLVPQLVALRHRQDEGDATQIYLASLRRAVLGTTAIALGFGICSSLVISFGNATSKTSGILSLLPWMLPILPFSAAANIWRAVLNAHSRFRIAAGAIVLTPLAAILTLLFGQADVYRLAITTTIGSAAEVAVLCVAIKRLGLPVFTSSLAAPRRRGFHSGQYLSLAATGFISNGAVMLNQSMAAALGPGAVAVFNFGTRLTSVLNAIGPEAIAVSLLPVFSRMMISNERGHLARSVRHIVLKPMLVAAAIGGLLAIFSVPIVRFAFERGAFQADDTVVVAAVQRLSLLQLPFSLGIALLSRVIASARANRVMVPITAAGLVLNALLNILWMRSYAISGVAAAATVTQACTFLILFLAASRILRKVEETPC